MKTYKEWLENAQTSQESWGWEIVGSVEEVIAQLRQYPPTMYCIATVEKEHHQIPQGVFANQPIAQ